MNSVSLFCPWNLRVVWAGFTENSNGFHSEVCDTSGEIGGASRRDCACYGAVMGDCILERQNHVL